MMFEAIVEVRTQTGGGAEYWEPIAGFDTQQAAEAYVHRCKLNNPQRRYRLRTFSLRDVDRMLEAWAT
jgi:hypothetical protein